MVSSLGKRRGRPTRLNRSNRPNPFPSRAFFQDVERLGPDATIKPLDNMSTVWTWRDSVVLVWKSYEVLEFIVFASRRETRSFAFAEETLEYIREVLREDYPSDLPSTETKAGWINTDESEASEASEPSEPIELCESPDELDESPDDARIDALAETFEASFHPSRSKPGFTPKAPAEPTTSNDRLTPIEAVIKRLNALNPSFLDGQSDNPNPCWGYGANIMFEIGGCKGAPVYTVFVPSKALMIKEVYPSRALHALRKHIIAEDPNARRCVLARVEHIQSWRNGFKRVADQGKAFVMMEHRAAKLNIMCCPTAFKMLALEWGLDSGSKYVEIQDLDALTEFVRSQFKKRERKVYFRKPITQ